MRKTNECKIKFLLKLGFCFVLLLIVFLLPEISNKSFASNEYCYLSDIDYDKSSKSGWGNIIKDSTSNGSQISVKIEGGYYSFEKGMWAHASSVLIYDLRKYDYDYFTAYMGLNKTAASSSNGVKFKIYTSTDGKSWNLKTDENPVVCKPGDNATFVKIDIRTEKFLKLEADSNGGNGNDHSVYADAKLIKETYKEPGEELVPSITELDEKIRTEFANANIETNKDYELILLKRELISKVGNYALKKFLSASEANKQVYTWLTSDVDTLRLFVLGGTPDGGSYYNALTQLSRLYEEYKDDFTNTELLNNKWYPDLTYGELYKKMAFSIALTHSQRVGLWMQSSTGVNESDALRRYAIFKYMHKNGNFKISETLDYTPSFEALHIEEMRFVLNNAIDDEEIIWLNEYVKYKIDQTGKTNWLTPHPHMAYVWPNYQNSVYYDENNRDYFNELFAVNGTGLYDLSYTIPGGKNIKSYTLTITRGTEDNKIYKLWMNFRNKFGTGAVCGGISKSGSNIRATHGIPATVIGQPGHAALLYYTKNSAGQGYWGIDNDVSGWTLSEKGERMLLSWGNANYSRGYSVVYMVLAQEAINDYDNLVKCEEKVMLANTYQGNLAKQEKIYREALKIQPINIDAWVGLINVYNTSENKTEDEYYALAEEVAENLKCFPLPMQHLTNLIKPKLTSVQNLYKFTLLQTRILTQGSELPNTATDQVLQPSVTRVEANYLLGKLDKTIATFSFDGPDAGKIVLSSRFDGNGVRWDYSLDGKKTWNEISFTAEEEHKLQLTLDQIASITEENDIYIHIVGVNYDEENLYKIDITKGTIPSNLFANDLENRVVGVTTTMEWRMSETDNWTSYENSSPNLNGNKTVQVRVGATGTSLTSDIVTLTYTEDNQPDTRKYIPVSHLSIKAVSTEATSHQGSATNAIDANYNTRWHSAWNGTDKERYITIELDKPVYLSAVEFVPAGGGNGRIYDGTIWGSTDGENWEELTNLKNITYPTQANTIEQAIAYTKSFEIEKPKEVKFVKIVADRTNGNWFTARAFNLFQDLTINPHPTAGIGYSTTEPTNNNVIARLINPSTQIKITNNNGSDTYIFTENGEFTFEFEDAKGNKGTAIAKVDWIDKNSPTADIKYSLDANKKLLILLDNISEDVYLLDKNNNKINYVEVNKNKKVTNISYLDAKGNTYKVVDIDEIGNTEKITYKNTTGKVLNVQTYVTTLRTEEIEGNKVAIVEKEEYFDSEGNSVTLTKQEQEDLRVLQDTTRSNPLEYALEKSGDYEFRILDKANNIAYKSIKVDYIENNTTILASDITYDITRLTNNNVVATINPYKINEQGKKIEAEIINHDSNQYVFNKNGKFIFEYKDALDTNNWEVKQHEAKVDWIDKTLPTAIVAYSTTDTTNKPVTATLTNKSEEITITNNNGSDTYVFNENGEFTFKFKDRAGNIGSVTAKVDWINKTLPTAIVAYSTTDTTNKPVTATLTNKSEEIIITNNNGSDTYVFNENGEFTFEFKDKAGNIGSVTAKVDWIDKTLPTAIVAYSTTDITNKPVTATLTNKSEEIIITNNNGKDTYVFNENGEFIFEFKDKAGNTGSVTAKVDWIKKEQQDPIIYQLGDVNKDGRITSTDLLLIKRHLVAGEKQEWILKQDRFNAGDINEDGKITATDLILIKRLVLKQIKTQ